MVKSMLDDSIEYTETRDKDSDDLGLNSNVYETTLYDIPVNFVLGNPKFTYLDNKIIYYPIYLVQKEEIVAQIGVYEVLSDEEKNKYDEDGDIDLNKLDDPLLYAFTYSLLTKKGPSSKSKKSISAKGNWIKEYMSDDDYDVIDTPYDGNCFFSVLKMAIEDTDQETSIEDMRDILVAEATEELFLHYKLLYEEQTQAEINLPLAIKQNSAQMKALATKIKTLKDRNLLNTSLNRYEGLKATNERLKREQRAAEENLVDCRFMKGIENLEMLKLKMKTREYWADAWAIATLERELGIKTIILSELNYKDGDLNNIIQCGDTLPNPDIFEPAFYVLVCYYGGYHYQMISYKNDKAFTYEEIPEEIKRLVVDKCLEKIAGPYSFIPEFKNYALKLKTARAQAVGQAQVQTAQAQAVTIVSSASSAASSAPETFDKEPLEETSSDLYDGATTFRFYSKSSDRPFPGKGQGETLGPEGKDPYKELAKIPDWRKKLANFWKAEFKLDGHRWASVEHYYQASKFKRNNKDFYIKFSLDTPDSSIAKDPEMAKAAGGKSGKFKGDQVRDKHIVVDPDFFDQGASATGSANASAKYTRGELEMEAAMRAKFTQNSDLKALLIATKKAKLEHANHGKPGTILNDLMRVRRELQTAAIGKM